MAGPAPSATLFIQIFTTMLSSLFALLTLIYPTYVFGGTSQGLQWPMSLLATVGCGVWLCGLCADASRRHELRRLARNPTLYAGLAFLALLTVQWLNAGRELQFDLASMAWQYTPPAISWLPSAIVPDEAREMLIWFGPAIWLMLWAQSATSRMRHLLINGVLINGIVWTLFAIGHQIFSPTHLYGVIPMKTRFYGGFGYENHAGSYNVLLLCIGLGLIASGRHVKMRLPGVMLAICGAVGAHLTQCRAAIGFTWIILGLTAFISLWKWGRRQRDRTVTIYIFSSAVAAIVLAGFAFYALREKKGGDTPPLVHALIDYVEEDIAARRVLLQPAFEIWRDHLWFGAGGWGYRHLLGHHLAPADAGLLLRWGKANVHNDLFQFLAEFGLVGVMLMLTPLVIAIARQRRLTRAPQNYWAIGLVAILFHSLIDLPFRSPAVLYLWLVLFVFSTMPVVATTQWSQRSG